MIRLVGGHVKNSWQCRARSFIPGGTGSHWGAGRGEYSAMTSVFCFRTVHFIYFHLCMYFWLCWVFIAARGLFLLWRAGPPVCGVGSSLSWSRGPEHTGFSSCGSRALGASASAVWGQGLSGPTACGIFPDQGLNLCPLPWKVDY